jgi:uncharacterized phage protein (TIGR02220 family)
MDRGWISIYRKIRECDLLWDDKPFSRGQAWIDLLLMANHEDKEILFNGTYTKIERGQRLTSIRKLSEAWGWSRTKTTKFLNELEKAEMLTVKSDTKKTLVTIVNYALYQDCGTTEKPPKSHRKATEKPQKDTNNNEVITKNNENKDILSSDIEEIISYLNQKTGKNFKATTESTKKHIGGRLKEGYSVEDFKRVIDVKCNQWLADSKMSAYLRPETLFAPSHFEAYLNEAPAPKPIQITAPEEEEEEMTDEEFFALVDSNFGEVG